MQCQPQLGSSQFCYHQLHASVREMGHACPPHNTYSNASAGSQAARRQLLVQRQAALHNMQSEAEFSRKPNSPSLQSQNVCIHVPALTMATEGHSNSSLHITPGSICMEMDTGFAVGMRAQIGGRSGRKGSRGALYTLVLSNGQGST